MLEVTVLVLALIDAFLGMLVIAFAFQQGKIKAELHTEQNVSQSVILKHNRLVEELEEVTRDRDGMRAKYSN